MSRTAFIILGIALLCAMPILGTFDEPAGERVARLSAPAKVLTAPRAY